MYNTQEWSLLTNNKKAQVQFLFFSKKKHINQVDRPSGLK